MMKRPSILLLVLSIFMGCQKSELETSKSVSGAGQLFSLEEFVNDEIAYLESNSKGLTKIISINGKEEKQIIDEINWTEELAVIRDMDIDKPAWYEFFKEDTMVINEQLFQVIYKTDNLQIPIKKMTVHVENDTVKEVEIQKERKSFFFKSNHHIKYESRKGYSVLGFQKALFISKHEMTLSVYYN